MNFTLDKKKCIYIVIWLLIGLLSFTVLGKYASAPESHQATIASLDEKKATVLELTAATTATSALITLLPGDIGTPIAEKVADLSGYLLIVLCAVFLEKYLVTITGYAAFKIFIPAACVLYVANMMARNRSVDKLARRLLIFGICIFLVVPASVKVSDLIETTYQSQIDATLEDAKSTQEMLENSSAAQQEMEQAQQSTDQNTVQQETGISGIFDKAKDALFQCEGFGDNSGGKCDHFFGRTGTEGAEFPESFCGSSGRDADYILCDSYSGTSGIFLAD